ncbi:uncharacterized protein LOC113369737 isoform X2 [Ctenocephalides felis]|uniref:uncharacterized protein LOC113369737 isoform X2 n=1 Tax=Ctenocephalides felis TaxID=7515 RepID=UPI000E6E3A35|nr:uncharacterized protein LOC113369737 isoform X2 [Ctenocephalides felis]
MMPPPVAEAPAPSSFYQDWRTLGPTSHYRYPTPYDITPCPRYHAPAAPYTQSIYHGSQYQWPRTTDRLDILKDRQTPVANQHQASEKAADMYSLQNQNMSQYHQQQQSNYYYQHNDEYKYLANRYHYDMMKKETIPNNSQPKDLPAVNHYQEYTVKSEAQCPDVSKYQQHATYFSEKDVPKISKLLNDQPSTVHKPTARKQNESKAMPAPLLNAVQNSDGPSFNSLMNMDSQQLAQLNSTDLTGLSGLLEPYCLPNEKTAAEKLAEEHESMTDSFTKMSTNEIEDLTVANVNNFNNM